MNSPDPGSGIHRDGVAGRDDSGPTPDAGKRVPPTHPSLLVRLIKTLAVATVVLAVCALGYGYWRGYQPINRDVASFTIEPGTGVGRLARRLVNEAVIDDAYSLIGWAYALGYTRRIQAGEYHFPAGTTLRELLDQIVQGRVIQYSVTFIEGWTFRDVLQVLRAAEKLAHSLSQGRGEDVMERLGHAGEHPEGRFFPDTYYYTSGSSDLTILRQAYERMQETLRREWESRAADLSIATEEEALILASIIEKETGVTSERPLISSVFHNRLRMGMRLQTDPTLIYGLGERFDGNLRRRDLQQDHPYNTYTRRGLPPTPIAMPGADSIHAALHPARSRMLYFVARGDGSHQFSETLAEHNAAVAKYQLGGRSNAVSPQRRQVGEP